MGHRGWQAWALAALVLSVAGSARAQSTPARAALLPPVPELRLKWPITPLAYHYTESEVGGYRNGPLQLFRAESLWLAPSRFRLLTYTSSERAFELDCSVTCQPVTMRGLGLEARWMLPDVMPVVSEPHLVVRSSGMRSPLSARAVGTVHVGVGGFLNF
jgi:hypothetical protein